jgi:hypothetical protein
MRNVNQRQSGLHGARFLVGNKIRVELDTCSFCPLSCIRMLIQRMGHTAVYSIYVQESICTIFSTESLFISVVNWN